MKVKVDYDDGTEPEEIDVSDGSVHFHAFPEGDTEKHSPTVEVLEEDTPEEPDEEEGIPDIEEVPPIEPVEPVVEVGYDPGAHTIPEVEQFAQDNPDQWDAILDAEEAGKNRVTLMDWLSSNHP